MSDLALVAPPVKKFPSPRRKLLRWMGTFAGFPIGGYVGYLLTGPVDDLPAAVLGGALTGAVIGATQAWGLRLRRAAARHWTLATTLGVAVGLAAGAAAVDYRTGLGDLAVQGAITGLAVGVAQAIWLSRGMHARRSLLLIWPVAVSALWALGWVVTTSAGIAVGDQFPVFGSSGALVVTALTAVASRLLRRTAASVS